MEIRLRGDYETRQVWINIPPTRGFSVLDPSPSFKYINHSPDGFNWGYGGSGPAQLAAAICLKIFGRLGDYQQFKFDHIAKLPNGQNFDVTIEFERRKYLKV